MKNILFLIITAFLLLCSCTKEEKEENNTSEFTGTGKWWYVECMDINTNYGFFAINGRLDYGNFYFHPNGKYSRKLNPRALISCQDPDSYIIYPYGPGPFGDITSGTNDSTWTINGNILNISSYGSWEIIEQENAKLVIKSSRTDYNYYYTLISD